jgi:peroxiredoxin
LKAKGVDLVAVIASNDAWVMAAWGKVNGVTGDTPIYFLSDTKTFFSKNYGWAAGMGDRNGRWAMVIEKDGSISYAENEQSPSQVTVSIPETGRDVDLVLIFHRFLAPMQSLLNSRRGLDEEQRDTN